MNCNKLKYKIQGFSKDELVYLLLELNRRKSVELDIEKYLNKLNQSKNLEQRSNNFEKVKSEYDLWLIKMRSKYGNNFSLSMLESEELKEGTRLEENYKKYLKRQM